MSLITLRNRVNTFLSDRWPAVVAKQDEYYATHGKYWQGLWTHNAAIDNTDEASGTVPDALDSKPTDQAESWRDRFSNALDAIPFPARLRVDVYDGPGGHGWSATVEILYNGTVYRRSQGVGPQADDFTSSWAASE